jgi:hypothetical protein
MANNYQVRYNDNTTLVIRSSETGGVHTPVVKLDRVFDDMQQTLTYSSGNISTITATDGTNTWVRTFTYSGGLLTVISAWVLQ